MKPITLTVDALITKLTETVQTFPDTRRGANKMYSMTDAVLGAFSVFFTQSPSFLSHQIMMEKMKNRNNARSLFGIQNIPSDNQIRNLLDPVSPNHLDPVFDSCISILEGLGCFFDAGQPNSFRVSWGDILIALDGTWYCSSPTIACAKCLTKKEKNDQVTYYHSMITPVIVTPGKKVALALAPEYIVPQDGSEKQDCENRAAKRWIRGNGKKYTSMKATILGDDLYAHQPMIEELRSQGFNYILVCKPESHTYFYEWIGALESGVDIHTYEVKEWNGSYKEIRTYRYASDIPLKDSNDAVRVNWCEVTVRRERDGKQMYHNAFITNHSITETTVADIVLSGRTRWKVENESNNTLKTKGYHLEHNYGHGKLYLASLLAGLTLLSFLFHTLLEMGYELYRKIRAELPTRIGFFNDLRAVTTYWYFDSWEGLLRFMMGGLTDGPG